MTKKSSATTTASPIKYPDLPDLNLGSDRQKALGDWYESLKNVLSVRFEEISTVIDQTKQQS